MIDAVVPGNQSERTVQTVLATGSRSSTSQPMGAAPSQAVFSLSNSAPGPVLSPAMALAARVLIGPEDTRFERMPRTPTSLATYRLTASRVALETPIQL